VPVTTFRWHRPPVLVGAPHFATLLPFRSRHAVRGAPETVAQLPLAGKARARSARCTGAHVDAISLRSCDQLRAACTLTSTNGRGATSSGWVAFTVLPRCSPLDLVRLWRGRGVLAAVARTHWSVVAERPVIGGDASCGQARDARCSCWARPHPKSVRPRSVIAFNRWSVSNPVDCTRVVGGGCKNAPYG
jgi:hypothetical protein